MDIASIEWLLERYADDICKLVLALRRDLGPDTPREELLAIALPGLVEARRRFDPARGVKFWVFAWQRVRGAILDDFRTQQRLRARPLPLTDPWGRDEVPSPETAFERAELAHRVRQAVDELAPRERIVVRGIYLEGRLLDDIGAEIGVSRSRASRIHTEALRVLHERLAS